MNHSYFHTILERGKTLHKYNTITKEHFFHTTCDSTYTLEFVYITVFLCIAGGQLVW